MSTCQHFLKGHSIFGFFLFLMAKKKIVNRIEVDWLPEVQNIFESVVAIFSAREKPWNTEKTGKYRKIGKWFVEKWVARKNIWTWSLWENKITLSDAGNSGQMILGKKLDWPNVQPGKMIQRTKSLCRITPLAKWHKVKSIKKQTTVGEKHHQQNVLRIYDVIQKKSALIAINCIFK